MNTSLIPPEVPDNSHIQSVLNSASMDIAYLASFMVVNKTIMEQKSYPSIFNYVDETGIIISGSWLSWQLGTGGEGNRVIMTCIVESGNIYTIGQEGDLTGTRITLELNLNSLANADPVNNSNVKANEITESNDKEPGKEVKAPAINLRNANYPNGLSIALLNILDVVFLNYFMDNMAYFNHIFALMLIDKMSGTNVNRKFKPIHFQYIAEIPKNATLENCLFGLIARVHKDAIKPSRHFEEQNCSI